MATRVSTHAADDIRKRRRAMVSGACEPGENTTALYVPSRPAIALVLSRSSYRTRAVRDAREHHEHRVSVAFMRVPGVIDCGITWSKRPSVTDA